jgi:hypothetical protein
LNLNKENNVNLSKIKDVDLPLSWVISKKIKKSSVSIYLPVSGCKWISLLNLNNTNELSEFFEQLKRKKNYIIRGIHKSNLTSKYIITGSEAVLNLNSDKHFRKKSIIELIKRGYKQGKTFKLVYSNETRILLSEFIKNTKHYSEPKLRYLYRTEYDETAELYVFSSSSDIYNIDNWLGAITLSLNDTGKAHIELLLRNRKAKNGVMEALIYDIFEELRNRDFEKLSLGEVPFVFQNTKLNFLSVIVFLIGRSLPFAYNYKGLFNFKNKFLPEWENVYLIYSTKFILIALAEIFIKTNLLSLTFYKLKSLVWKK